VRFDYLLIFICCAKTFYFFAREATPEAKIHRATRSEGPCANFV
jgi:hypothetical protein